MNDADTTWRQPDSDLDEVLVRAAVRQHRTAQSLCRRARLVRDGDFTLRWLSEQLLICDYDTMWAALRGRTTMTYLQLADFEQAIARLEKGNRNFYR